MANDRDELMRLAERVDMLMTVRKWAPVRKEIAADLRALAQRAPQNGAVPEGWRIEREETVAVISIIPPREICEGWRVAAAAGGIAGLLYALADAMLATAPAPEADQYADCCDTPAYCSSVRRCTAKDAAQYVANGLQTQAGQPEPFKTSLAQSLQSIRERSPQSDRLPAKLIIGQPEGVEALAMELAVKCHARVDAGRGAFTFTREQLAAFARRLASAQRAGNTLGINIVADDGLPKGEVRVYQDGRLAGKIMDIGAAGKEGA